MDAIRNCPVCDQTLVARKPWLLGCSGCGFMASNLRPGIGTDLEGIATLRRQNFERVLDALARMTGLDGTHVLEPGCAQGWFLEAARARGMRPTGLEPEGRTAAIARERGFRVVDGLFPDALDPAWRFDVIVFNDVFEHLPDVRAAREACVRHITPGGYLVINIPSSDGVFYRMAAAADRLGVRAMLDRMWQRNLPSPHVSYFDARNLRAFIEASSAFSLVSRDSLPTLTLRGLWSRLRFTFSAPVSALLFGGIAFAVPAIRVLPADILLLIFQRVDTQ